ncbi:MAG: hypothetical protein EPO68_12260 [Planctomycetota bacterium]|nr:MAG: hypothetical protein EPO68_12260 [Planctomycetota bacterium]
MIRLALVLCCSLAWSTACSRAPAKAPLPTSALSFRMVLAPDDDGYAEADTVTSGTETLRVGPTRTFALAELTLTNDALGWPALGFDLQPEAAVEFHSWTAANVDKRMAIVVGKRVLTAPRLNVPLPGRGIIENHEISEAEWKSIAESLGAPFREMPEAEHTLGLGFAAVAPTTGAPAQQSIRDGELRIGLDSAQNFGVTSLERIERGGTSWLATKLATEDRDACHAWSKALVGRDIVIYSAERVLCRVHLDHAFEGDALVFQLRGESAIQRVDELRREMAPLWGP